MKKVFSIAILFLVLVMLMGVASEDVLAQENSTLDKILDDGVLKAGVMLDFPPCGFYDDSGDPAGYEVEVAKRIADAMDVDLEIIETQGPSRIPALKSGEVDVVFGTLAITSARAQAVAFTRPYIYNSQWVIVNKGGSVEEFEDLKGKTVGTIKGTTPEINLEKTIEDWDNKPELMSYTSNADALMALRQGKVDAVAEAEIWFQSQVEEQYPGEYELVGPPFFEEYTGAAVRPEDQQLLNFINTVLWEMIVLTDEMNELNEEYYNTSLTEEVMWGF